MAKNSALFDLALRDRNDDAPAYRWLYCTLRDDILSGRMRPGTRLPSTRDLAKQYQVSRGTIVRGFEELRAEGYIEGTIGSGTFVSRVLPEELLHALPTQAASRAKLPTHRKLADYGRRITAFSNFENHPSRPFRTNVPALDLFPMELWAQTVMRRLRRASTFDLLACDALGFLPLRQAVADYLTSSRGVKCSPEQVAIVAGVQEGLNLVARLLVGAGDRVCIEDPGYPGAVKVFEAVGARVVPLAVDEQGMKVDKRQLTGARMIYVTPAHQFPLGMTMSLARRLELLEWARRNGATIFEDDYDSEYRYSGRPIPAMQGLDSHGVVIFAGTFNKVLFPSLRLGYLVIPPDLIDRVTAAISLTSRHAPVLEQAALCDFILDGHFGRHLRHMRLVYAERFEALKTGVEENLAPWLTLIGAQAGLQVTAWLSDGLQDHQVVRLAAQRKIDLSAVSVYSRSYKRNGLQLGFAAFDTREIHRGLRELAKTLRDAARSIGNISST